MQLNVICDVILDPKIGKSGICFRLGEKRFHMSKKAKLKNYL